MNIELSNVYAKNLSKHLALMKAQLKFTQFNVKGHAETVQNQLWRREGRFGLMKIPKTSRFIR
jgi:hypothetical protein